MSELSEELRFTKTELEEKRQLSEKLELDLLQMEAHKPSAGDSRSLTPSGTRESNGLADLDLDGKRSANASIPMLRDCNKADSFYRIHQQGRLRYPLFRLRTRLSFPSSQVSETASGSATPNLKM